MHEAKGIKLGYTSPGGEIVNVQPSHLIVTGVTQLSGKTTTLEALIHRSGKRAIVFKTKIGEKSFSEGTVIAPFFRDRSDYEFVKSLIEAYAKEKMVIEKGTLMTLCKGSKDLIEIKRRIDDRLHPAPEVKARPLRGLQEEIYVRLEHYLENLIPQVKYANFSATLNLVRGINIMNLEQFTEEAQSLIIQSTADEVLKNEHGVIIVIPEAWKFIPQKYNNPCKRTVEAYIRQGAANENYIWINSQDMAGVDKIPMKSISTWILGYQSERNEVEHTLDQISLPKKAKPKGDEIMNLRKGHFFISSYDGVQKVYVQPKWMDDNTAIEIAIGDADVDDPAGEYLKSASFNLLKEMGVPTVPESEQKIDPYEQEKMRMIQSLKVELVNIRTDFFEALKVRDEGMRTLGQKIYELSVPRDNTDEVVAKVLQKLALQPPIINEQLSMDNKSQKPEFDKEALIREIIARIPKGEGQVVYEIAPIEMIKRKFIQEAKDKIIAEISGLSDRAKKVLKYAESKNADVMPGELITKCLMLKPGGGQSVAMSGLLKELVEIGVIVNTPGKRYRNNLKTRISFFLIGHDVKPEEIENLYNHIIVELLR